jgi:toxin ParE1/3/4
MRVEWLEKALKNLEDEANYIALENPKAADDFSDAIFVSVDGLAQFPSMGREGRGKTYPRMGSSQLVLSDPV